MLLTVRSRRRAASAKSSVGSGATSKPRWPGPRLLSRRGSEEVDVDAADPQYAERAPDRMYAAEAGQQRLEPFHVETEHLDVDVLRAYAEEMVAHPAAHDEGAAAGIAHGLRDLDAARVEPRPGGERHGGIPRRFAAPLAGGEAGQAAAASTGSSAAKSRSTSASVL